MANLSKKNWLVGSRASPLALAQTHAVIKELKAKWPDHSFEIKKFTTQGDRVTDRFLFEMGGKGLFVKELEDALISGEIDFAVHSLKDMPAQLPPGLDLLAFPKRAAWQDGLISTGGLALNELKPGANIGTASPRRRLQLQKQRADLKFSLLRGNIQTRIKKLNEGSFDAIVLAMAGIHRMAMEGLKIHVLDTVPAPGQGILGLEGRQADEATRQILDKIQDPITAQAARLERSITRAMAADCNLPLGCLALAFQKGWSLQVFLSDLKGELMIEAHEKSQDPNGLGLAEALLKKLEKKGMQEILKKCRDQTKKST